ncbi:hypothetical protein SDRG_06032 [Saprolegnia diclina VS20]|uniref:Uncharacterized protein n=1 Tax=Saprolegnia diclina (strain VS20) TaxID=1156394 RepID=T0RVU7_SAPDV|nr:hypothetical protein SDRG_06032 [Saprolegnia diclina VS20]EQC36588.1 hypothetical protein SDRG_06032 [Saprolegnia diclina VS20]|eukprot:XP_008610009.1 hypothetical protein SDRG_06032 [Saprolegnia diclina VS20]
MFLRGGCALLLLATAPVTLTQTNGVSVLVSSGRPFYEAFVLAGEANWITYVMYECQLVFHPDGSMGAAAVIWCIYSLLDVLVPVTVTTTLERNCSSTDYIYTVTCTHGAISIGSLQRLYVLLGIQAAGLLIAVFWQHHRTRVDCRRPITVLFTGVASALLHHELDDIGYILTGLISLQPDRIFFDVKLWVIVRVTQEPVASATVAADPLRFPASPWHARISAVAGFLYVVAAVSSSYSYLQIAKRTLVNDLIWPGFNLSSTHVFLTNCLWGRIAMNQTDGDFMLTDPSINAVGSTVASTTSSPTHFGARMQYSTLMTLVDAVHGLRATDACDTPWIFTPYCYLDFGGAWDMAATATRQARCRHTMATNAAVYLESLLRNVEWDDWVTCWGPSFDSAFGKHLATTRQGQAFLASVSQPRLSVADEVTYWQRYDLESYELQWQNFKVIGLDNTYSIVNALGLSYPFTLQRSQGYFRREFQTTYKLYWSLANDLANLPNQTSLLRASPAFAYANASLEDVYLANATFLTAPLPAGYAVVRAALGPFGAIDAVYVEVPRVVRAAARDIMSAVATHRARSLESQAAYATLDVKFPASLVPAAWLELGFESGGGSLLCPDLPSTSSIATGVLRLFHFETTCTESSTLMQPTLTADCLVVAALLTDLSTSTEVATLCLQMPDAVTECEAALTDVGRWTSTMAPFYVPSQSAAMETLLALNISFMQYGSLNGSLDLYTFPILDPSFRFFGWTLVLEWILGKRDVVTFAGDDGALTLLSDVADYLYEPVQAAELPTVLALYAHATVQYITFVMAGLAAVASLYIVVSRGRVEGLNMLELSPVGGIVWVGRPLLVVRSVSALCLLSTATTLSLHYPSPYLVSFATEASSTLTTCLAASEVTWLVGILNDICLAITREHSIRYITINSLLVWSIAACLSSLQPVEHRATMDFRCVSTALDFQVECSTGSIAIGFLDRVLLLIAVIVACNCVCYGLVRALWPVSASLRRSQSLLLTAGAKYLFTHDGWLLGDVYYMDRASALLSGLLTVSVDGVADGSDDDELWDWQRSTVVVTTNHREVVLPDDGGNELA